MFLDAGKSNLRSFTQPKFINHDGIAEGVLNINYSTASGFLLPWKSHLTNTAVLLDLVLVRLERDWTETPAKSRKPWGLKDLVPQMDLEILLIVFMARGLSHWISLV